MRNILFSVQKQLKTGTPALLIIDMQSDFVDDSGKVAKKGGQVHLVQGIVSQINTLVARAREGNLPIIWVRTEHVVAQEHDSYLAVYLRDLEPELHVDDSLLVTRGSTGANWCKGLLTPSQGELVITKSAYSAFHETDLESHLQQLGITTLILTGCNTDVCLYSTAAEGFFRGYYPVLVEDASASSTGAEVQQACLKTHKRFYGHTITTEQLVELI